MGLVAWLQLRRRHLQAQTAAQHPLMLTSVRLAQSQATAQLWLAHALAALGLICLRRVVMQPAVVMQLARLHRVVGVSLGTQTTLLPLPPLVLVTAGHL